MGAVYLLIDSVVPINHGRARAQLKRNKKRCFDERSESKHAFQLTAAGTTGASDNTTSM
jgi:hypothetical protein